MTTGPTSAPAASPIEVSVGGAPTAWHRFRRNLPAVIGATLLAVLVLAAIFAPLLTPYSPNVSDLRSAQLGPSGDHWLGTDEIGRDVFTRMLYAGRVSLTATLIATGVATVLGLPAALAAGYLGGRVDTIISRLADLLMTLPTLILAIAVIAIVGPGLRNAMIVYGVMMSPRLYRIVRSSVLSVRVETYIEASLSLGTPKRTILRRHVLPNVRAPFLVEISIMLAQGLVAEASLSFLGLGVVPPTASWGQMLSRAFAEIREQPFQIWPPGIAVALTALCFNLVADGLRDALGREERRS